MVWALASIKCIQRETGFSSNSRLRFVIIKPCTSVLVGIFIIKSPCLNPNTIAFSEVCPSFDLSGVLINFTVELHLSDVALVTGIVSSSFKR